MIRDESVLEAKIQPLLIHAGPMRQDPTGIRQLRLLQSGKVWIDDFEVPELDIFPALISRNL
ncbi:MAG: hypothetical protein BEV12_24260 [Microcystis aeruginosa CACIAM 03]|nr:MAG: hypothetical protein BEV12_24260 [Microcystis aeruginosa CACIAM 03]